MRASGLDVITLAAGEPQAPSSPSVIQAAIAAAADSDVHHYGPVQGDPEFLDLISSRLREETGLNWEPSDIQATIGAKHALALAAGAVTSPGDEILVANPGWPGHASAAKAVGAVPKIVKTDELYRISVEELENARTELTRALIISSPGNPTGAVYPTELIAAVTAWATEHNIWIISDDIYSAFDYTGSYEPLLKIAPEARGKVILIGSVSKEHAMTGWRIGWLAAPSEVIAYARSNVAATISQVPNITQRAAIAALKDIQSPLEAKSVYRNRRDRLVAALTGIPGVNAPTPDGGMFVFADVSELLSTAQMNSSADLAAWLLVEKYLAVVPGEAFDAPGKLRLCFAIDDDVLDDASKRLRTALLSLGATDQLLPKGTQA